MYVPLQPASSPGLRGLDTAYYEQKEQQASVPGSEGVYPRSSDIHSSVICSESLVHHSHGVHPEVQYSLHQASRDIAIVLAIDSELAVIPGLPSLNQTSCSSLSYVDIPAIGGIILCINHLSVVGVIIIRILISFTKSFYPSPPLCLGVLGFGQITCNLPIKFYQDIPTLFLGDRALGSGGEVEQDLFVVWCYSHTESSLWWWWWWWCCHSDPRDKS